MAKLSAAEIEQHFEEGRPAEDAGLTFVEPEHDECVAEPYDYSKDDWLFDDYYESLNEEYNDRYDDPYPHDEDFYL